MRVFIPSSFKAALKTVLILLVICFVGIFTVAMKAKQMADDVWKQLGLPLPDAQKNINNSFIYGDLYYYGAKNAKNIAMGNRVAVVNQIVEYAKKYTASPEFKNYYLEQQNKKSEVIRRSLPAKPEPKTVEAIKAEEKLLLEKRLSSMEANLSSPNANVKKTAALQVENIKKEMQAL